MSKPFGACRRKTDFAAVARDAAMDAREAARVAQRCREDAAAAQLAAEAAAARVWRRLRLLVVALAVLMAGCLAWSVAVFSVPS